MSLSKVETSSWFEVKNAFKTALAREPAKFPTYSKFYSPKLNTNEELQKRLEIQKKGEVFISSLDNIKDFCINDEPLFSLKNEKDPHTKTAEKFFIDYLEFVTEALKNPNLYKALNNRTDDFLTEITNQKLITAKNNASYHNANAGAGAAAGFATLAIVLALSISGGPFTLIAMAAATLVASVIFVAISSWMSSVNSDFVNKEVFKECSNIAEFIVAIDPKGPIQLQSCEGLDDDNPLYTGFSG